MSENKQEEANTTPASERSEKPERLHWVDTARGFIMVYLVVTLFFPPSEWKSKDFSLIMYFLFDHAGTTDKYMTLYDVGAAAFIFVLGLMMAVSYQRHKDKEGKMGALKHLIVRYIMLLVLAVVLIYIIYGAFIKEEGGSTLYVSGIPVIYWDVVPAIAVAGFVTIFFVLIEDWKIRMAVGYVWGLIYQILMNYAGLKEYAQASVHGGIFGSIFGYAAISIVASALGQYMALDKAEPNVKSTNMALFGLANLGAGLALAIPSYYMDLGWEAAKRQVSFSHDLISIGVTVLGLMVFVLIDQKYHKRVGFLEAYGANPFMAYYLGELINLLLEAFGVGKDLGLGWIGNIIALVVVFGLISWYMLKMYKEGKVISTPKVALIMLLTLLGLGIPLLLLGVL